MAIFIKTSQKNYTINLIVSGFVALFSGFFLYKQSHGEYGLFLWIGLFIFIIFLRMFRVLEYILTKKSIAPNKIFLVGDIDSGKEARIDFYWNLVILIFFELLIIFYKYIA